MPVQSPCALLYFTGYERKILVNVCCSSQCGCVKDGNIVLLVCSTERYSFYVATFVSIIYSLKSCFRGRFLVGPE